MKRTLALTALLALKTPPRFGDGDDDRLTRAEWERQRAADLAKRDIGELASKVAALEYDLKVKRTELEDTQKKLPQEGSVLLSKSDAERWAAYQTLGKPDEIKTKLGERDTYEKEAGDLRREKHLGKLETIAKVKMSALQRVAPEGVTYEAGKVKDKDGNEVDAVLVKDKDGKDLGELREWIGKTPELADFKVALFTDAGDSQGAAPGSTTAGGALPFSVPMGGAASGPASRTPADIAAEKRASGEYSM